MRTPNEAFKDMCVGHGETWNLTDGIWRCVRKDEAGNRYVDPAKTEPPLPVLEMVLATGLTWVMFDTITGDIEPLITKEHKSRVRTQFTPDQLDREAVRIVEMKKARMEHIKAYIMHALSKLTSDVKIDGLGDLFAKAQTPPSGGSSN